MDLLLSITVIIIVISYADHLGPKSSIFDRPGCSIL